MKEDLIEKGILETKKTIDDLVGWKVMKVMSLKDVNLGLYTFSLDKTTWFKDLEVGILVNASHTLVLVNSGVDEDLLDIILETITPTLPVVKYEYSAHTYSNLSYSTSNWNYIDSNQC